MKPPRFVRKLTQTERDQIDQRYRHGPNARIRKRAQAIRLSSLRYTVPQISGDPWVQPAKRSQLAYRVRMGRIPGPLRQAPSGTTGQRQPNVKAQKAKTPALP